MLVRLICLYSGDSGYPLEPWLLTQFLRAAVNSPEDRFNAVHRKMRNCIERVNGILKMRWRCLLGERMLRYQPEQVIKFVNVCCALHNVCIKRRVQPPAESAATPTIITINAPNTLQNENTLYAAGARNRQRIMSQFV